MSPFAIVPQHGHFTPEQITLIERVEEYLEFSKGAYSPHTDRARRNDLRLYAEFCSQFGYPVLPVHERAVTHFLEWSAVGRKLASIKRYMASIALLCRASQSEDVTKAEPVRLMMRRLHREMSARQHQASPITESIIQRILVTTGEEKPIDLRDVTMLLIARDLLARRSELVALNICDITPDSDGGATVLISRSKTDQQGEGNVLWISPRAFSYLERWLNSAHIQDGPCFRSVTKSGVAGKPLHPYDVTRIFKKLALRAKIDPISISSHSCRIGMAQDLVAAGEELPAVMQAGRWKSPTMVARYTEHQLASRNAVARYYSKSRDSD